jgi:chitin synthase
MGLLAVIGILMLGVGFLTFGFTITVCSKPPQQFKVGEVDNNSVIINGVSYNLATFKHPKTKTIFNGSTNPLRDTGLNVASKDVSFMFQNVNGSCKGIIGLANGSAIAADNGSPHWFFPCNMFNQFGTSSVNKTGYDSSLNCHATVQSRQALQNQIQPAGMVTYSWDDVTGSNRNLAVYQLSVFSPFPTSPSV